MKQKWIAFFAVLTLCIAFPMSVFAASSSSTSSTIPDHRLQPRVVDNANLLTASEEQELEKYLDSISAVSYTHLKLDKKAAKAELRKHLKGKPFLPGAFKTEHHIDEIKGVYVPFWLFDADVDANIRYRATKIRKWRVAVSYTHLRRSGHDRNCQAPHRRPEVCEGLFG